MKETEIQYLNHEVIITHPVIRDTGQEHMYSRKPDASLHDPSPAYLRSLLETAGISQEAAATALGITDRVMRYYLSRQESATYRPAPYAIQYALEQLAAYSANKRSVKRT